MQNGVLDNLVDLCNPEFHGQSQCPSTFIDECLGLCNCTIQIVIGPKLKRKWKKKYISNQPVNIPLCVPPDAEPSPWRHSNLSSTGAQLWCRLGAWKECPAWCKDRLDSNEGICMQNSMECIKEWIFTRIWLSFARPLYSVLCALLTTTSQVVWHKLKNIFTNLSTLTTHKPLFDLHSSTTSHFGLQSWWKHGLLETKITISYRSTFKDIFIFTCCDICGPNFCGLLTVSYVILIESS